MRGEREKDIDALMGRYGIGRRLATRVVALLSRNIDVTGTLLAEAGGDGSLEKLLLDSALLTDPQALSEQYVRRRAEEAGFQEAGLLRVIQGEGEQWRTLALEDDLLVEGLSSEQNEGEPSGLSIVRHAPEQISTRETQELFAPEEVARLKLEALTSQDIDQRTEALRKLVFAPMEGARKAQLFVTVLTDGEAAPRVRREAIRSLQQIGFRTDMAEAITNLFGENHEDAVYAIQRLGSLLREADEGEAALCLAVVLEVLGHNRDAQIIGELLRLVRRSAPLLLTNYQKTEYFVDNALRQLARAFDELRFEVQETLEACAREAPRLMAELFWKELDRAENARVRSLLLTLSESLAEDEERLGQLAVKAITEILNPSLPESEKARLRYAMVRLGEPAALDLLERIPHATGAQRAELIHLLDVICTESDVSEDTLRRSVVSMLDMLKLADTITRRGVVQTSLLADERVPADLQGELSNELLTLMTELNLPDSLDSIQNTLLRIGGAALEPAYKLMRRAYPSQAGERAATLISDIIVAHPEQVPDSLARELFKLCKDLLEDESVEAGAFVMPLAAVCGYTDWGREVFDDSLEELNEKLWRLPYSMEALEALAVMGGAPNASPRQQSKLFELFDSIVKFQAPSSMGVRRQTEEGPVYEFGREIQFDIRAVPAAVRGLERICVSDQASAEIRAATVKRLLVLWEGVSKVRIIWGPAAIDALIRAMCSAACDTHSTVEMKVRLGASLLRFLNKIRVVESLGEICSRSDADPRMQQLAIQTASDILDEYRKADPQDEERRLALLEAAARIAANTALAPDEEQVSKLRERTLQALFHGLRAGLKAVRGALQLLRDCPDIPAAQKHEIDERLTKAFGLVRMDRRK
ncbi:MAG: hypothetical protein J7M08_04685 [Planctomycetes bacterium]|nr:hypothetical protein [Planctomycetota bacterium]